MRPLRYALLLCLAAFGASTSVQAKVRTAKATTVKVAAPTAAELARELEQQLLVGKAVTMGFTVKGGDKVSITAELGSKRVRIDSKSLMIVTDGKTVWNYKKLTNQVTVDNLSQQSGILQNPQDLFHFADNYTAELLSSKGGVYSLKLTPKTKLEGLFKQTGGITSITFQLQRSGKSLKIKSAAAQGESGTTETGALTITSVKAVNDKDFSFAPPKGVRVIDLRE